MAENKRGYILLNAKQDLERALSVSLANFTKTYLDTGNITIAKDKASQILYSWKLAFTLAHGASGLEADLAPKGLVFYENFSYVLYLDSEEVTVNITAIEVPQGEVFVCNWDDPLCSFGRLYRR